MLPPSVGDTSPRIAWLRAILLGATFCGMLVCMPLWMNVREYPLLPVSPLIPTLPAPWDKVIFGSLLGFLVVGFWFYRFGVVLFLLGSAFLVLADQNRTQPWFYIFWVMLLFSTAPAPANLAACRYGLAAVYVWGGIQKCNPAFFKQVVPWLVDPASKWLSPNQLEIAQWIVAATPFIEMFIGTGLWLRLTRLPAIIALIVLHAAALFFLGPLGRQYGSVVWAWNIAMPALVIVLFPRYQIAQAADLREFFPFAAAVVLFWLLPILSYFGLWPSYLSFAALSGNVATADMFVAESFRDRLPESMRSLVHPTPQPFNPNIQGSLQFDHQRWAIQALGVPSIPEPNAFLSVGRYLVAKYAAKPYEVRLIVAPRYGPTTLYQGSQTWQIVPPANSGDR